MGRSFLLKCYIYRKPGVFHSIICPYCNTTFRDQDEKFRLGTASEFSSTEG